MHPVTNLFWQLLYEAALHSEELPLTRHYLWFYNLPPYSVMLNPHNDYRELQGRFYQPGTAYVFKDGKMIGGFKAQWSEDANYPGGYTLRGGFVFDSDELMKFLRELEKHIRESAQT